MEAWADRSHLSRNRGRFHLGMGQVEGQIQWVPEWLSQGQSVPTVEKPVWRKRKSFVPYSAEVGNESVKDQKNQGPRVLGS